MKQFNTVAVIGRFQLPHIGHERLFQKAAELADNLVIVVGSVGQPKTPKNPFSFGERKEMLVPLIPKGIKYDIIGVRNQLYSNTNWAVDVVNKVNSTLPTGWTDYPPKVALVGHKKDKPTADYLNMFRQWKFIDVENYAEINATDIRNFIFNYPSQTPINLPISTMNFINKWKYTDSFREIQQEHDFYKQYDPKDHFIIMTTVDAVVLQSGHILMIKRVEAPGKGLWALPGGFLEPLETLREAVLRELIEETQIKLQEIILDRSITCERVYDHPERSQRGRTITHAFKFDLVPGELPRIKGASDAAKAKWIPLNEVFMMGEFIYEDHLDIIMSMV